MSKDLASIIRLARWAVDERRRALAALLAREEELVAAGHRLEEEFRAEQAVAGQDALEAGFTYGGYAGRYRERREALQRQLQALRAEIEAARDDLADAYRQLKTYELAQAARERREREERDRKEQALLDEIGQEVHRRRTAD